MTEIAETKRVGKSGRLVKVIAKREVSPEGKVTITTSEGTRSAGTQTHIKSSPEQDEIEQRRQMQAPLTSSMLPSQEQPSLQSPTTELRDPGIGERNPFTQPKTFGEDTTFGQSTLYQTPGSRPYVETTTISRQKEDEPYVDPRTGRPPGMMTLAPERKGLDKFRFEAAKLQETSYQKSQRKAIKGELGMGEMVGTIGVQLGAGAATAVSGFGLAIMHPIRTGKSLVHAVTHPKETGQAIAGYAGGAIQRRPVGFIGEIGGYVGVSKAIGYGLSKSPLKIESATIKATTTKGTETPVRGVGVTFRGKVVKTFTTGKVAFKGQVKTYQPVTASQTEIFTKNIGKFIKKPAKQLVQGKTIKAPLQREFAVKAVRAVQEQAKTKSKFISKESLMEGTERLSPQAVKATLKVSKKKGGTPYGSFSSRGQLAPQARRMVRDIDVHFETKDTAKLQTITKDYLKAVEKSGMKARIPKDKPYSVETFKQGGWEKAIEVKGIGIGDSEGFVPYKALGYELDITKSTTKIGGYKVASLVGETKRKLAGSVAIRETGRLAVTHVGRFKDVPDLFRNVYTHKLSADIAGKTSIAAKEFLEVGKKMGVTFKQPGSVSVPIRITGRSGAISSLTSSPSPYFSSILVSSPVLAFQSPSNLPTTSKGFYGLPYRGSVSYNLTSPTVYSPISPPRPSPPSPVSPPSPRSSPPSRPPSPTYGSPTYSPPYKSRSPLTPYVSPPLEFEEDETRKKKKKKGKKTKPKTKFTRSITGLFIGSKPFRRKIFAGFEVR